MREQHQPIYDFLIAHHGEPDLKSRLEALAAQANTDLETILAELDADTEQDMFERLYAVIGSQERWQADVRHMIETGKNMNEITRGIYWRRAFMSEIGDELLAMWYKRFRIEEVSLLRNYVLHNSYSYMLQIESGNLPKFRAAVAERGDDTWFAQSLFRRYATQEEWENAAQKLLEGKPTKDKSKVSEQLAVLHSEREEAELPLPLQEKLIKKYGEEALEYLNYFVNWRFRALIEEAIASTPDNQQLLAEIRKIQGKNWSQFVRQFSIWAKLLYARDAAYFGSFIWDNTGYGSNRDFKCIRELVDRARRDGHRDLFRKMAATLDDRKYWNADVREVLARRDLTSTTLALEMDRLDVRRSGVWVYKIFIDDDNAAKLYSYKPDIWREYVWRYLVNAEAGGYSQLLQAIQDAGDDEFYIRVFRRVATQETWDSEMEKLFARDLPPERILEEIDKRKPTDVHKISPGIMHKFLTKYGDAVMPFFENYIDWASPERLNALFELDIDRGELLKELQAIARRQPFEFGNQAKVWAIRLYDKSPDFFGRFVARYLTRANDEVSKELLRRFEANKQYDLFEQLFPRIYWGKDWDAQINALIDTVRDDQELITLLQRRTSRWQNLSDEIAEKLYARNATEFRPYIIEHLGSQTRWWSDHHKYNRLENLAKQNKDTELLNLLKPPKTSEKDIDAEIRKLVKQDLSWEELDAQAKKINVEGVFHVKQKEFLTALLKRYGEAMIPAMVNYLENTYWQQLHLPDTATVKEIADPALYRRYIFARRDSLAWTEELEKILDSTLSDEEFAIQLTMLTPSGAAPGTLSSRLAESLYRRSPSIARPFIERFLGNNNYYIGLLEVAGEYGDNELQDSLTALALLETDRLIQNKQYEAKRNYQKKVQNEEFQKIKSDVQPFLKYLDALYKESPAAFVQHASAILRHVRPGREGLNGATLEHNLLWKALTENHWQDWQRDPAAIRDLLESPNFLIQITALNILRDGSPEAAARVVENLRSFHVLLLSDTFKDTKRAALECLEAAGRNGEPFLSPILELLQIVVDFTVARRSISDEIAVSMARLLSLRQERIS